MIRRFIFLIGAIVLADAPLAMAQSYDASVLYPLPWPVGIQNGYINSTYTGQTVGSGFGPATVGTNGNTSYNHALLWPEPSGSVVDLNPTGSQDSRAYDTNGLQQVGYAGLGANNAGHAILWSGTAASAVDLNPTALSGINGSDAYGISPGGTQQVGYGSGNHPQALLWSGTAASAINLNPTALPEITFGSVAYATDGTYQVGVGMTSAEFQHAILWSGTAASAVDLNPTNATQSVAYGVSGRQQVGFVEETHDNAALWTGTAASAIDLNPIGFSSSFAYGTNGSKQVGYGSGLATANFNHALLWSGSAGSVVDLSNDLPGAVNSFAYNIDTEGNVYGIASFTTGGNYYAVEWSPLLGDANGDGKVNAADLAILNANMGQNVTGGYADGDFNGDGIVNVDDFTLLQLGLAEYNQSVGNSLPEPVNVDLGGFAAIGLSVRRRRR